MKITILGCGGAAGVPTISKGWGKCDPNNPRNRRRRPAILVEEGETKILVDTPPDLRDQLIETETRRLDAVLFTHNHADHIHGLDDLREINRAMNGPLDIWGDAVTLATLTKRFEYAFTPMNPGASFIYKPLLNPREITGPFSVNGVEVLPLHQDHGYGDSLAFRFGKFAYSTDLVRMPEETMAALVGIDVWIVACLVDFKHETHADVETVLGWVERLKPRQTILTHMSNYLDYETLRRQLPSGVEPGYDGMVIDI
jgi:phosphoribosyl 1,2-cyclic phosphate phosphodiesterase